MKLTVKEFVLENRRMAYSFADNVMQILAPRRKSTIAIWDGSISHSGGEPGLLATKYTEAIFFPKEGK